MSDDDMRRIRSQQERLDERERERRQELRHDVLTNGERDAAIAAATRAALFGSVPSIVWYLVAVFNSGWEGVFLLALSLTCLVLPFVLGVVAAGVAAGLFAHWWFQETAVSVRTVAVAIALLADAALLGWVILLTR